MSLSRVGAYLGTCMLVAALGTPTPADAARRRPIRVQPGESIQAAIDAANPGSIIQVEPGTYHESVGSATALTVGKDGIRLIGLSTATDKVILEAAPGGQQQGILVAPNPEECGTCHTEFAPPFPEDMTDAPGCGGNGATINGFKLQGFTLQGFEENGLLTRHVDHFQVVNNESIDNGQYGIFPTLSSNGVVNNNSAFGSNDSGIWIETSENIVMSGNFAQGNVNGFEISNSENVVVAGNEARDNTVGIALLLLPGLERNETRQVTLTGNWVDNNNKPNTATPDSILSFVPPGIGILMIAVDESVVEQNLVENHDFAGIALVDYCAVVFGTPFECDGTEDIDPSPENNLVTLNTVLNNGTNPSGPFSFLAADLAVFGGVDNCFIDNIFNTSVFLGGLSCP